MSGAPRVLVVCADTDDRALAVLVLRNAFAGADVVEAGSALDFADHLAAGEFGVAVAAAELGWARGADVLAAVGKRYPECVTVLLGGATADAGGVDASVATTSHGFMELSSVVERALALRHPGTDQGVEHAAYERLVAQLPVGIFSMAPNGAVREANAAFVRLLGFRDLEALIGRQLPDLLADVELRLSLRVLLERGQSRRDMQARMRRADGGKVSVSLSFWPIADDDGRLDFYEAVLWDLSGPGTWSARPLYGQSQVEQLTSAVSHDLQDPLQLIAQHSRLLAERHGAALDDDAKRLVGRLRDSAARMQSMIDDMLEFARVSQSRRPFQVVDMNQVVGEAVANLEASVARSGAQITHGDLPSVVGEPRLLVQLFQNLVGNAIKFVREAPPRISLAVEEREEDWLISVTDNGPGIDPLSADRIFEMFQRLHATSELPGRGVGLAICRRIAECHGGRIWVESRTGEGSTFFVTLTRELPVELAHGNDTNSKAARAT